jgi:hypothetical protein
MSAYLIEVDDTKQGVIYPAIVGPFPDAEAANAFAEKHRMGQGIGGQGGYHDYHIIGDETCGYTPEAYAEAYAWRLEEDESSD